MFEEVGVFRLKLESLGDLSPIALTLASPRSTLDVGQEKDLTRMR